MLGVREVDKLESDKTAGVCGGWFCRRPSGCRELGSRRNFTKEETWEEEFLTLLSISVDWKIERTLPRQTGEQISPGRVGASKGLYEGD